MRQPIGIKSHYPNGVTLLDKAFDEAYHHEKGPGALPVKHKTVDTPVRGIIVPHGSLPLIGPCSAWAYKALAEERVKSDVYVIVAQAQHSTGAGITMQTFALPYGEVRVDQQLARAVVEKGHIAPNDELHAKETVIEVQLPHLQFIHRNSLESVKILPILLNHDTNFDELAVDIKEALLEQNKTASFIFVSNMVSYGREFKYAPFGKDVPSEIAELDKKIIDTIVNLDHIGFASVLKQSLAPISGHAAIELYFRLFHQVDVTLESYYLSGDLNNNYANTVSYAALVIR